MNSKKYLQILGFLILILFIFQMNPEISIFLIFINEIDSVTGIFILLFTGVIIKAILWKYIIKKILQKEVGLFFSVKSIFAGIASGALFPARIDLAKGFLLSHKYDIKLSSSMGAVVFEKLIYLNAIFLSLILSLFFVPSILNDYSEVVVITMFLFIVFSYLFIFNPQLLIKLFDSFTKILDDNNLISEKTVNKLREPLKIVSRNITD